MQTAPKFNGWSDPRPMDEIVCLRLGKAWVVRLSDKAVCVRAESRKGVVWFPKQFAVRWGSGDQINLHVGKLRVGDEVNSVQIPRWLKREKVDEFKNLERAAK